MKFRLSIDLLTGKDIVMRFGTIAEATAEAEKILKAGYAVEDRSTDPSKINSVLHPLAQIRSLSIYEA